MKRFLSQLLVAIAMLTGSFSAIAKVYYVAPDGNNTYNGTKTSPFATIEPVQSIVAPGDTVYFRGGTYQVQDNQRMRTYSVFAQMNYINKSGQAGNYINYWAYPGEKPVLDFSDVKPSNLRVVGFYIEKGTQYLHFKGLEITGVQVMITSHTESYCIYSYGSNNIFEGISMHDNQGTGLRHRTGGGNLFLNCDAYRNHDYTSESGTGSSTDGFGCHPTKGGTGNVFRGCRSWFNSDDGYDVLGAEEAVVFERSYAMYNGYDASFKSLADGNGFKAGGYGSTAFDRLPNPIPSHTVRFCVAVGNKQAGFYSNHHLAGSNWYNNSAYENRYNYKMLNRKAVTVDDYLTDVDGYDHYMRNNVGLAAKSGELANINKSACDLSNNYWDGSVNVTAADFKSLDKSLLTIARNADYTLPETDFMQIAAGSDLIDAGTPIAGYPYNNDAPDLGAFESPEIVYEYYTLDATVGGQGQVAISPGAEEYREGTLVELSATPVDGWQFIGWSGDITSTDEVVTVTMDSAINVEAVFEVATGEDWAIYEAELGDWSTSSAIRDQYEGFSWTGYLDTKNTFGEWLKVYIDADETKTYALRMRYASTSNRPVKVSVNGEEQIASLSCPSTNDWGLWDYVNFDLDLTEGVNEIRFLTIASQGAGNIDRIELLVGESESVADITVSEVKVYPNPVRDVLTITGDVSAIKLYDITGKLVYSGNGKTIDMSGINNGIYLVNVTLGSGEKRVMKCIKTE